MRTMLLTIGKDMTLTGAIPMVPVGEAALITLTARGGSEPYTITVQSEDLPAEWTITPKTDGTVDIETAEAETAGEFTIVFRLKDGERDVRLITRTLRVVALPLEITGTLPNMTVGDDYTELLAVTGGIKPYTVVSAAVPAGINVIELVNQVSVSGNPTGVGLGPGTSIPFTISITIEDDAGNTVTFEQGITITVAALNLTGTPDDAEEGVAYSYDLTRTGGVGAITITAQSGLPSGVTASVVGSTVRLSGTPASGAASGSPYSPSISIEDSEGNTDIWNGTLDVDVPFIPNLDGLSGVWLASARRRMLTAYAGNVIEVEKVSTGGLTNIGFDVAGLNGVWDEAAIATAASSSTGRIKTWYGQSGTDLVQSNSGRRPDVYRSGAVLDGADFVGPSSSRYLQTAAGPGAVFPVLMVSMRVIRRTTTPTQILFEYSENYNSFDGAIVYIDTGAGNPLQVGVHTDVGGYARSDFSSGKIFADGDVVTFLFDRTGATGADVARYRRNGSWQTRDGNGDTGTLPSGNFDNVSFFFAARTGDVIPGDFTTDGVVVCTLSSTPSEDYIAQIEEALGYDAP